QPSSGADAHLSLQLRDKPATTHLYVSSQPTSADTTYTAFPVQPSPRCNQPSADTDYPHYASPKSAVLHASPIPSARQHAVLFLKQIPEFAAATQSASPVAHHTASSLDSRIPIGTKPAAESVHIPTSDQTISRDVSTDRADHSSIARTPCHRPYAGRSNSLHPTNKSHLHSPTPHQSDT